MLARYMREQNKIRVGLIGFGYWGPNLCRNVSNHPMALLTGICDSDANNRRRAAIQYPGLRIFEHAQELMDDSAIDAIVIATSASTHAALADTALTRGKHVLVTKPISTTAASAAALAEQAKKSRRVLLVDHTFLYTPAVAKLRELLDDDVLGDALYYDAMRTGLGIFKSDADVVQDLTVHDVAIVDYLFSERPTSVTATSVASIPGQLPSLAYVNFHYRSGLHVHIASHWLSPIKQRKVVIAGNKRMASWDDTLAENGLHLYDSGVSPHHKSVVQGRAPLTYRHGEGQAIPLERVEALTAEVDEFIDCIRGFRMPISCGYSAARVMLLTEAASQSARAGGACVYLNW